MCGSKPPAAPKPDPNIGKAAMKQAELAEQYLAFTKEQFAISQERQAEIDALAKEVTEFQFGAAKEDRARYEEIFRPLEDEFIAEAKEYASPEKQAEAAAKAKADVQSAAAGERGAIDRRAASMGISPESGRYQGIDRAMGLGTAVASVGAQNQARDQVRDKGLALKAAAVDMGRGLPSSAAAGAMMGQNANTTANQQYQQSTGIVGAGYQGAMQGYGNQASILNQQHANQISIWNTQNEMAAANAQGFGKLVGTRLGLILSSKKAKTNRKPVEDGAALEAVEKLPVDEYDYKPGMGDGGHHVGPMAEDFAQATGQGDGTTIAAQDAIGLTMGAVKDLSRKVDRISEKIGLGIKQPAMA